MQAGTARAELSRSRHVGYRSSVLMPGCLGACQLAAATAAAPSLRVEHCEPCMEAPAAQGTGEAE